MRIGTLNVLSDRFLAGGYAGWIKRRPILAAALRRADLDAVALTECYQGEGRDLARDLGMQLTGPTRGVAWLTRQAVRRSWPVPLDAYHAGLIVEVVADGRTLNLAGVHLSPSKTTSSAGRRRQLGAVLGRMAGWRDPIIVAGDLNDRAAGAWLRDAGYQLPGAPATMRGWSTGPDYIATRRVTLSGLTVLDAGAGSDHDGLAAALPTTTTPAPPAREDTMPTAAVTFSRQLTNQYAGAGAGPGDSEATHMQTLAGQVVGHLRGAGITTWLNPGTDVHQDGRTDYRDEVAWSQLKPQASADALFSLHSNAAGDSLIMYGSSKASTALAGTLLAALKAHTPMPYGDAWTISEKRVAILTESPQPAVLIEVGRHDQADYAAWLRASIKDGSLGRRLAHAIMTALGVPIPTPPPPTPAPDPTPAPPTSPTAAQLADQIGDLAAQLKETLK